MCLRYATLTINRVRRQISSPDGAHKLRRNTTREAANSTRTPKPSFNI